MRPKLFFVASIILVFAACAKEKTNDELILGKWELTSCKKNNIELINSSPDLTNVTAEFKSDMKFILSSNASTDTLNYSITSTNLYLTDGNDTVDYTINLLNEDSLKLISFDEYPDTLKLDFKKL